MPCYNAALFCEAVIEATLLYTKHLILIDDGSSDGTREILEKAAKKHPHKIELMLYETNRGKGFVLLDGMNRALEHTSSTIFITIDSDGQHAPSDIPPMAAQIDEGASLVIGTRQFNLMPLRSKFANTIISSLLQLLYKNAPIDTQSGYRVFNRPLVEQIVKKVRGGRYEMEFRCLLLALVTNQKIVELPISTVYLNNNRASNFHKFRDSTRILKVLWHYWRYKTL